MLQLKMGGAVCLEESGCLQLSDTCNERSGMYGVGFFVVVCCLFHNGLLRKPLEAPLDFSLDGSENSHFITRAFASLSSIQTAIRSSLMLHNDCECLFTKRLFSESLKKKRNAFGED